MADLTYIISGENIFENAHNFLLSTAENTSPQILNCIWGLFLSCLHWLAIDIQGFFVSGVGGVTASAPGMLCLILGGAAYRQRGAMFQIVQRVARIH